MNLQGQGMGKDAWLFLLASVRTVACPCARGSSAGRLAGKYVKNRG